ncbi:MMPL family transporter [Paraburkholderia phenazinium]|uniref:Predicted exporter n=1 Tax=Paraburkholderia phenazinium TaxID=60549 RepID=A0A1G7UAZ1_9BURK|nr:MMPL family transporter [Paraburkholderia phenazinium]SDG44614.1 Predicted exporter [Paraburkholderia phenazinium]
MREPLATVTPAQGLGHALRQRAVLLWLVFLLACAVVISRTTFTADLSAFLPRSPSAGQRVLVDQLRDGLVSRLILVGIEGGDSAARATLSRRMAASLRGDAQFASVNNGEPVSEARDQRFIFEHRYLLSPAVTPQRFSADGLHQALGDSLDLLGSSAGMFTKDLLPHDPTGEVATLVNRLDSGAQPNSQDGVWASRDGRRAVLVVQTAGAGSDTDAQARAMAAVQRAFDAAAGSMPNPSSYHLLMTGPGVFSVETRDNIKHDVARLSAVSLVLIVALLLVVYRSPLALLLGLLPVLSGVAAGLAAVSLAFGTVHGLTLGFGTTLIGEAVDYSIYLFVQSSRVQTRGGAAMTPTTAATANTGRDPALREWIATYWPTIRLGVLTSICGFASMLFSGFPGLVQLGLYSIAGLTSAALVTRFVLPHLRGARFAIRNVVPLGSALARFTAAAPRLRWLLVIVLAASVATLGLHRQQIWSHELSALSPVSPQSLALDESLRDDVGAPDVRYLVVISGASQEAVLEGAEKVAAQLQPLVDKGVLAGYESPALFLPSVATQRARLASLPPADVLTARMREAVANQAISVKPEAFGPFIADVQAARQQALLQRADLQGTSMALAVDALLTERAGRWSAMLSLRAPAHAAAAASPGQAAASDTASLDAATIRAAVAQAQVPDALFVDMKAEADRLYINYVREDIHLSLAGLGAIVVLLLIALRSPQAVARTLAPLLAAVLVVSAGLALAGEQLTILHLIGMLLIVAVGSNYALFFNRPGHASDGVPAIAPQTLVSLLIANLATVAGFGLLALARVPLLKAFGLTVGPGAILALLFSAILAPAMTKRAAQRTSAAVPDEPRRGERV